MTESSGSVSVTRTDEENRHYGTAGLLAVNVEAKVVDITTGKAMPPNHKGELWLRGPTIMKGTPKSSSHLVNFFILRVIWIVHCEQNLKR